MNKGIGLALLLALGAGAGQAAEQKFPERILRGYGKVSADFSGKGDSSVLSVRSATPAAAELWQAKFHSDITSTIGTAELCKLRGPRGEFYAYKLPAGGWFSGVRKDAEFRIFHGKTEAALLQSMLASGVGPTLENTRSAVKVPMYLNSWDQYAFRFYYRVNSAPPKVKESEYDPLPEFEFASRLGSLGLVFWTETHNADFAQGVLNENAWRWAYKLAEERGLPVVLNTNMGPKPRIGNDFRADESARVPHYIGGYHSIGEPFYGGAGFLSWASVDGRKAELAQLQKVIAKYGKADHVIEYLEPHGELYHGNYTLFLEHGPVADRSFRAFLKERYATPEAVSSRYYGAPGKIKKWDEIRLPELAEFAGWNEKATDLSGSWRLGYLKLKPGAPEIDNRGLHKDVVIPVEPAPASYYDPAFDDSSWPMVREMPGSDQAFFIPKRPAVLRRKFSWDKEPSGKMWLYMWDLNAGTKETVTVYLNGKKIGSDSPLHTAPHWGAYEVTNILKKGDNLLAANLPKGAVCYRVYLSPTEPKKYPYLGPEWNARWVDFIDWQIWARERALELGMGMIREADPDKSIVCMAPDRFSNQVREAARKYGAHFHNTGYMSGSYHDLLPMLMRGAGLPFSIEPSAPARDQMHFKKHTGLYMVCGVNAIHYFIHLGSIYWDAPIREYFERVLPALRQLGQRHQQKAEVALLHDSDIAALLGYPWMADGNVAYPSGYWSWRFNETLVRDYPMDALIPADFSNTLADAYRVIIDTNSTVLRPETQKGIEKWVRNGGIFLAMPQTGRHAPEAPDAWPAQALTGFVATSISRYKAGNQPEKYEAFSFAPGQKIFQVNVLEAPFLADGVKLKSVGQGTETLATWADGSTAIGMRRLGKGMVITFGTRLLASKENSRKLLCDILRQAGITPLGLVAEAPLYPRHFVSNNGLYDVWVLWNSDEKKAVPYTFKFRDGKERVLTDVLTGKPGAITGEIPPLEFKAFTSPRNPEAATAEWFNVQYNYWQGTEKPPVTLRDATTAHTENTLNLDGEWEIRTIDANEKADFGGTGKEWSKRELTSWVRDVEVKGSRFLARRTVVIPKNWSNGSIYFWNTAMYLSGAINGTMTLYIDGKPLATSRPGTGLGHVPLAAKGGDTVVLGLLIENTHPRIYGVKGGTFLSYIPNPSRVIDLAGEWEIFQGMTALTSTKATLPGTTVGNIRQRQAVVPALKAGNRVFLYWKGDVDLIGAMVNGHYVRRHHHRIGELTYLDVTPWVRSGASNEIMLLNWDPRPEARGTVQEIKLYIYEK